MSKFAKLGTIPGDNPYWVPPDVGGGQTGVIVMGNPPWYQQNGGFIELNPLPFATSPTCSCITFPCDCAGEQPQTACRCSPGFAAVTDSSGGCAGCVPEKSSRITTPNAPGVISAQTQTTSQVDYAAAAKNWITENPVLSLGLAGLAVYLLTAQK